MKGLSVRCEIPIFLTCHGHVKPLGLGADFQAYLDRGIYRPNLSTMGLMRTGMEIGTPNPIDAPRKRDQTQ